VDTLVDTAAKTAIVMPHVRRNKKPVSLWFKRNSRVEAEEGI
jgi:hypothetical protein